MAARLRFCSRRFDRQARGPAFRYALGHRAARLYLVRVRARARPVPCRIGIDRRRCRAAAVVPSLRRLGPALHHPVRGRVIRGRRLPVDAGARACRSSPRRPHRPGGRAAGDSAPDVPTHGDVLLHGGGDLGPEFAAAASRLENRQAGVRRTGIRRGNGGGLRCAEDRTTALSERIVALWAAERSAGQSRMVCPRSFMERAVAVCCPWQQGDRGNVHLPDLRRLPLALRSPGRKSGTICTGPVGTVPARRLSAQPCHC